MVVDKVEESIDFTDDLDELKKEIMALRDKEKRQKFQVEKLKFELNEKDFELKKKSNELATKADELTQKTNEFIH